MTAAGQEDEDGTMTMMSVAEVHGNFARPYLFKRCSRCFSLVSRCGKVIQGRNTRILRIRTVAAIAGAVVSVELLATL